LTANNGQKIFECTVENAGLSDSEPQDVLLYRYGKDGRGLIKRIPIPSLKPYQSHKVTYGVDNAGDTEYELIIPGTPQEYWKTVDISDSSVQFNGDWKFNPKPARACFMGSEKVSETYGDSVTFTFYGTRAVAYGGIGRKMGTIAVYLDGDFMEKLTCRFNDRSHENLYKTPLLADGKHTLTIKTVKGKGDWNGPVTVDSFAFETVRNIPE